MDDKATKLTALIIASLGSFITPFMVSSINIALPAIGKEFRADAVLLSWVATSYLLAAAVSLVPFGKLADIYGRKKIYIYGITLFTLTSLLSAVSISVPMLIFFRIFQGAGSAMVFATGIAILTSVYPIEERGKVLGIAVAAVYTGLTCGPFFGGFLTHHFSWRSIFIINIPFGGVILVLIFSKLKGEWKGAEGQTFDLTGSIIYGTAIFAFMYGFTLLPETLSMILILTGLVGLTAFVKWETVALSPVFEVNLFRNNRTFAFSCVAALINYGATFAVSFLLSLYLQYIKGLSPQNAGLVLVSTPVMMAIFSPLAGRLSDSVEPRVIASLGMGLTALGLMLLILLDNNTVFIYIIASLMILGFGFALFSSPNMNAIMSSVDKRFYGIASASVGTMRLLGQMLSMGIATLIFALFIGRAQISPDYYPALIKSVRAAFIVFSVLCICGIFFSLYRGRLRSARSGIKTPSKAR
ncbi:MAG: MFS transporter [Deltaproteobacteria bacterium]|nr:MAG: MFS transporter [Deltaproteobacteria bacterium]